MIGLFLAFIAATCYGISAALQKYTLKSMEKFSIKVIVKNKIWLLSMAITAAGGLANLFALKNLELSTLQPFFGVTLLIPVLVGAFIFREKLKVREWTAVVLIIAGVLLVSIF
jgi:drug/metabolite transporter (DMT)-like permease